MPTNKSRTLGVWEPAADGKWIDPKHASWRDPASAGILLHDAFHHSLRDKGGNEREWESMGPELWQKGLDEDGPLYEHQLRDVATHVLCSLIELPEDGSDSRFQTSLRKPSQPALPIPELWISCISDIVREEFNFSGYSADNVDQYIHNAAGWAWRGYLAAQKTYPDPYRTKSHIHTLEKVVRVCSALAENGALKQWTARWDDTRGIRASWQNTTGQWAEVSPE